MSGGKNMRRALAVSMVVPSLLALTGPSSSAGDERVPPAVASPAAITLSFKLDPRLAGPTYGGERWVSPKTYTGASAQDTVDARARAVDAQGRRLEVNLEWTVADPEVVTVSPARGEQVRIAVKRVGQGTVTVKAGGTSRKLTVKVVETKGIRQVSISQ
jgi:hypothetical protein